MKTARIARAAILAGIVALALTATSGQTNTGMVLPRPTGILASDLHFNPLAAPLTYPAPKTPQPIIPTPQESLEQALVAAQDNDWNQPGDKWDAAKWDNALNKATYPSNTFQPGGKFVAEDTDYPLMTSALADAGSKSPRKIVLYTGDLMPHDFKGSPNFQASLAFRATTLIYSAQKLQRAFKVPVIMAFGNNDSILGDYARSANDPTFAVLANHLKVIREAKDPQVRTDFLYGGFYAIPDPSVPNQDLVVLNTSFWSNVEPSAPDPTLTLPALPQIAGLPAPGAVELWWLWSKLNIARAQGRKVRLVMHIPPGADAYKSYRNDSKKVPDPTVMLWEEHYQTGFLTLMRQYRDTLVTSFAGHTHQDEFRVLSDAGKPFLTFRVNPSFTTSNYNNPAYSVYTDDARTGEISDITTYYLPLSSPPSAPNPISNPCNGPCARVGSSPWQCEYSFKKEYSYPSYTAPNLAALAAKIAGEGKALPVKGTVFTAWQMLYNVSGHYPEFADADWRWFSCAQTAFTKPDYDACTAAPLPPPGPPNRSSSPQPPAQK